MEIAFKLYLCLIPMSVSLHVVHKINAWYDVRIPFYPFRPSILNK